MKRIVVGPLFSSRYVHISAILGFVQAASIVKGVSIIILYDLHWPLVFSYCVQFARYHEGSSALYSTC